MSQNLASKQRCIRLSSSCSPTSSSSSLSASSTSAIFCEAKACCRLLGSDCQTCQRDAARARDAYAQVAWLHDAHREVHTVEHAPRIHTRTHLSLGVGIDPHPSTVGKRLQHLLPGGARGRRRGRRRSAAAAAARRRGFRRWQGGGGHGVGRAPAGLTVLRDQKGPCLGAASRSPGPAAVGGLKKPLGTEGVVVA